MQKALFSNRFPGKEVTWLLLGAAWLLTLSFIIDNYWAAGSSSNAVAKNLTRYVQSVQQDFQKVASDTTLHKLIEFNQLPEERLNQLVEKKYFLFVYNRAGKLIFWNTQTALPDSTILGSFESLGFTKLQNGYYVWEKYKTKQLQLLALVPIKWNYIVINEYLQNQFILKSIAPNAYIVSPVINEGTVVHSASGKRLFSIIEKNKDSNFRNNPASAGLRLVSVLLVFFAVHLIGLYFLQNRGLIFATAWLLATLFLFRLLSYLFPIPLNFRQFELFDPAIYGSSGILRSLGDLLINVLLALWLISFVRKYLLQLKIQPISGQRPWAKIGVTLLAAFVLLLATFISSHIIRSLVSDSQISFDVINFFSLNLYSVIGFGVLCCIGIGYFFLSQSVMYLYRSLFPNALFLFIFVVCIMALTYLSVLIGSLSGGYELYLLLWVLVFVYLLNSVNIAFITDKLVVSRMIFWIFFFSVSITAIIIRENKIKELQNRQHYAEILSAKSDPASEILLNSMLTDFKESFLTGQFYKFRDSARSSFFRDSLVGSNFSGYTNKFNTKILVFDQAENPMFNEDATSYNQLNTILNTQANPTAVDGLYYYDVAFDRFNYIAKKTIVDSSGKLDGYVFILVTPKMVSNEKISPELFGKGIYNSIENTTAYSFAIYSGGKLVSSHNDYPFASQLPDRYFANHLFLLVGKKSHSELWYNAGADKYVVIVKENRLFLESITLFSYLFCGFLLVFLIFRFLNILFNSGFYLRKITENLRMNIRSQIHGTIIFFSILSFVIIGVATILFFINRYESNNREKLSSTIRIMERDLKKSLSQNWMLEDTLHLNSLNNFENTIRQIADIHGVDVNLYSLNGDLKASSLALPYLKGVVSTKMDPTAYFHLHHEKEVQFFQKERIGNLKYLSSYVPLIDSSGTERAYLNIPYFTSQSNLKQEISNFLVTIINLNAFIFLVAGIVALFITNRITHSFSLIGEKMKRINLATQNERIQWDRNDEIGSLVDEYNKMVDKLDKSAEALAKTEREGAWKEMARQVAHEIKNPLTPMKLSIQFLQKSIDTNAPNVKTLSDNVAQTLIEQIDHLSAIANEFSQFANIENSHKEKMDLNEALRSVKNLYTNDTQTVYNWHILEEPVFIMADKTQINRLFNNLIQNGLQAVPEGRVPHISITEALFDDYVLIKVSDNGVGISAELQPMIFVPRFTTKTSGTGLGLAMCKRIVEQKNGEIYFETIPDESTTFFVKLPLVKNDTLP